MKKVLFIILFLLVTKYCEPAFVAGIVFEYRTTGALTNSGCYLTGATGTDYSQQDASHQDYTDLVIGAVVTTNLTSVIAPFAADDVGNCIRITGGTGFTTGLYYVVSVAATIATVDKSVGTAGSTGGAGSLGGAISNFVDADLETQTTGNINHIKAGTYTTVADVNVTSLSGTGLSPIKFIGYNAARNDKPEGDNRPLIAAGENKFALPDFSYLYYLRFTTTASSGIESGRNSLIIFSKSTNSSGTANRNGFSAETLSRILFSEAISTNGNGIRNPSGSTLIYANYLHDSVDCIEFGSLADNIVGNIIDTCTNGINASVSGVGIIGNTFYNHTNGIQLTAGGTTTLNNIFNTCTTGFTSSIPSTGDYLDWNNWNNNGTDVNGVTKGDNETAGAPGFDDAAAGDFDIATTLRQTASPYPSSLQGLTLSQSYADPGSQQRSESTGGTNAIGALGIAY